MNVILAWFTVYEHTAEVNLKIT